MQKLWQENVQKKKTLKVIQGRLKKRTLSNLFISWLTYNYLLGNIFFNWSRKT